MKRLMPALLSVFTAMAFGMKDHTKIVGPETCIKCHKKEGEAWQQTHHFKTFRDMHRRPEAKSIADKLGIKSIKNNDTCLQCHYTTDPQGEPVAGISCESCHGPAKDWVKIHNDYGGKTVQRSSETSAHKSERLTRAEDLGMIHPANTYAVASNCYQCHTVAHEKLVEIGGHKAGSDFELVSWSQGEIRHNFLTSPERKNRAADTNHKRVLYLAGRILDLEYSLRGVAEVTKKSPYAVNMAKRAQSALEHVKKIKEAMSNSHIDEIYTIGSTAKLKAKNYSELMTAAEKISGIARGLLKGNDGETLSVLYNLIPTTEKGTAAP